METTTSFNATVRLYAPWFCSRPWHYTNRLLTYLLTYLHSQWQSTSTCSSTGYSYEL